MQYTLLVFADFLLRLLNGLFVGLFVGAVQHGVPGDLNANAAAVCKATIHCPRTMQYTLLVFASFLIRLLLRSKVQKFVVFLCYAYDIVNFKTSFHGKLVMTDSSSALYLL